MKSLKILVILLLVALLIFAFTACGDNNTDTDSSVTNDTSIDSEAKDSETVDSDVNSDSASTDNDTSDGAIDSTDTNITTSDETVDSTDSNITTSDETVDSTDSNITTSDETVNSSDTSDGSTDDVYEPWQSNASDEVIERVEELLASKHRLEYNDDGSFRVMVIADAHMKVSSNATDVQEVKDRIKAIVDKIQPNLVILTGDNTISSYNESTLRENITAIVGYIEEKQIPWCHVYGNHDHEGALSNATQQKIYQSFEYCISKDVEELSGTGTYVHGVYNKDGSLGSLIWLIDSGSYVDKSQYSGYYDFIKQDQIDWYKSSSLLIKEYNNGNNVKGIMAFHIPLVENRTAYNNVNNSEIVYEFTGGVNENMCPSEVDTNLLETIFELGDVKAIVTGHDHVNDYMINYKGVKLTSSPNLSDLTYFTASLQGSRIFDLNASTMDNVVTYVEYVIERLDSSKFESFQSGTVLEDFEDEFANPVISGWDSNTLNANVTVKGADKKGAGASSALSVSADMAGTDGNFEFVIDFDSIGKIGSNNYIIVWMDLTGIEFRKACIGFKSSEGEEIPFRTDDNDGSSPSFYYLADGASKWTTLSHGWDGCFGTGDGSSVINKKGYFAFKIDDMWQNKSAPTEDTLITGFYFYGSLSGSDHLNKPFYIDNVIIVEDYQTATLPTE